MKFLHNGRDELIARSRKEVILTAGTVSSAQLLLLFGIGPERHLQRHGSPVKRNLAVGRNLQDHVSVPLYFEFRRSNLGPETPDDQKLAALELAVNNTGPLVGIGASSAVSFVNTEHSQRFAIPGCGKFLFQLQSKLQLPNRFHINTAVRKADQKGDFPKRRFPLPACDSIPYLSDEYYRCYKTAKC